MEFENLNKKKIIFMSIAVIIVILIIVIFLTLDSSKNTRKGGNSRELTIWTFGDNKEKMYNFLNEYKNDIGKKSLMTNIENFDSWEEYNLALSSAIISGKAPDVFVLNSSENFIFENSIMALDSIIFEADKFRKEYKSFVGDKLIKSVVLDEKSDKKDDFVVGIPVGYESLGIYYNRLKGIQASDFKSWASLNKRIQVLKERRASIVPLGIGRGESVVNSNDIITQFLMLEGITSLDSVDDSKVKAALSTYFMYANKSVNGYDEKLNIMKSTGKNNLDLFSRGEIGMIVGYPRTLIDIDKKGFRKSGLYVQPFPGYFDGSGKSLVNFNYFVVNKNSANLPGAMEFMSYLNSDSGASKYLKAFPYYLSAKISLEEDSLESHILDGYNIKLKDFNNTTLEKSTFDKKIKMVYDKEIISVLDDKINYINKFSSLKYSIVCKFEKIINLNNLSNSCSK